MSGKPANSEPDAVVCEIEIAAPPQRVFQALTDPQQLFAWWGKEPSVELTLFEMDARPGGRWRFRARPAAASGPSQEPLPNPPQEFEVHGEVLEHVPGRLLVWSWLANFHEHPAQPTVVRWHLTPTATGTLVRVTHSALAQEPVARKGYASGWPGVLRLLDNFFTS